MRKPNAVAGMLGFLRLRVEQPNLHRSRRATQPKFWRMAEAAATMPFHAVLGSDALARLPAPVVALHSLDAPLTTAGLSDIEGAPGLLARTFCWGAGLPAPGRDVPVTVAFAPAGNGREHWRRRFGERRHESVMRAGRGRDRGLLIEHFGWFDLLFRLSVEETGLRWRSVGWRLGGVALPLVFMPEVDALESGEAGRFTFDIAVAFAWLGPVLRYKGWLEPAASA
jgi:hypothetical protein